MNRIAHAAVSSLFLVAACSVGPEFPADGSPLVYESVPLADEPYRIAPGDTLGIRFSYHPERHSDVVVRPDGKISIAFAEEVHAAGKSVAELDDELTAAMTKHFNNPELTILVTVVAVQRAWVGGEVLQPGVVEVQAGMTAMQALAARGWLKTTAASDSLILIRAAGPRKRIAMRLDMSVANAAKNDVPLRPFDILYAPRSSVAQVGDWVDQNINAVVPKMFSFGAFYQLNELKLQ